MYGRCGVLHLGRMLRVLLTLTLTVVAFSAHSADECPFPVSNFERIEAALNAAPTCQAAAAIYRACALRTGGDVVRFAVIKGRCERDFVTTLSATQMNAYKAELTRCSAKIKDGGKRGMDKAMVGGCAVDVAARYSARALRAR